MYDWCLHVKNVFLQISDMLTKFRDRGDPVFIGAYTKGISSFTNSIGTENLRDYWFHSVFRHGTLCINFLTRGKLRMFNPIITKKEFFLLNTLCTKNFYYQSD